MTQFAHPKYRPDIDGLRAVAVLSVVVFHAFPQMITGGFVGVDIFFVISGYLISTIIFENLKSGSFSFFEFYSRRVRRIFPALLLVVGLCFAFGWFTMLADEFKMLGKHMVGGALFISNILLWRESGYFDSAAETKPLLHLWSLGIEEQFYIVWPILLWGLWRFKLKAIYALLAFMLVSFAANIYFVTHNPVADFFSPLTRFWELLTGAFLAYMSVHHRSSLDNVSMRFAHIMSCTGFALLMLGVFYISKENAFPGWWAMLPVYGATLMIAAGPTAILNRLILSNKLVVWFGLISYPLYLWHWPLLAYSLILEGEDRSDITVMLLMAAAVLLAWLTFRFVERPLRYGDGGFKKTLILLSIMAVFCGIGAVVFKKDGFIDRAVSKPYADLYYNPEILHRAKCTGNEIARGLQIDYCALPVDAKGPATSVLLGDSHADDKYNGLVKMDNKRVWMLLGHGSCPPIYGIDIETEQKGCRQKSERAIDWVVDTANINIVALSFLGTTFMDTSYAADHVQRGRGPQVYTMSYEGHPDMSKEDVFYNGLNNAVEKLVAGHKKVILMADVPELPFFPKDCARHNKPCTVDVAAVQERQKKHLDMLRKIAANHKGVSIYNPHALLCNETACGYKVGDVIVYRDSHHLTLKGADLYAEDFLKWLKQQKP